jgi:hypothetical protein
MINERLVVTVMKVVSPMRIFGITHHLRRAVFVQLSRYSASFLGVTKPDAGRCHREYRGRNSGAAIPARASRHV